MQFFNKHCVWGIFLTLLPLVSQAQVSAYSFSQSAGTYTAITTGTSFTMVDNALYTATIPSFMFNGTSYTALTISTNGFIKFGTVGHTSSTTYPISSSLTGTGGIIAPFGRDLNTASTGTPEIRIDTAVGNEIVIQWQDVRRFGVTSERLSFQARLNKTNGQIKVVYGGTITPGSNTTYPEVGLRGATNADYNNRSIISTTGAWLNSVAGTANTASCYFNSTTTATVPAAGTTFIWTAPSCFAPSGLAAATTNGTTANFSWTTSVASGQLVIVPQGSAASVGTPSAVSGTSVTIGGLTGGTAYSAYIRNICGPGDTSAWAPVVNFTPLCANSAGLAVTTTTLSSATFSWTTSQTGQIVVVPQGSAASVGTPSAISGTTTTVSGLTHSTAYSAYIRRICGPGDTSTWSAVVNFATQCNSASLPWSENFENISVASGSSTLGLQPTCWAKIGEIYGSNGSQTYGRAARSGTKYAYINYSTTASTGDWMFTPAFNLTAGVSYDFSFWYVTDGLSGWDTLRVGYGTSQTAAAMTLIGTRVYAATNTAYTQYKVSFTPSTTGTYYLGVNLWAGSVPWYITFDDFNLNVTPSCQDPMLSQVATTNTTATFTWSPTITNGQISIVPQGSAPSTASIYAVTGTTATITGLTSGSAYTAYIRAVCAPGDTTTWASLLNFTATCVNSTGLAATTTTLTSATFSWATSQTGQIVVVPQGSAASVGTPSAISGTTATVSGLTHSTAYSAYIRRICGPGDTSAWSAVVNFATQCGSASLPWSESFENINVTSGSTALGVQPTCWAKIGDVYGGNGSLAYNRMARTGTKYASVAYSTTATTGDWMFTPAFNLTAGTSYDFSFWYITDGLSGWDSVRVGFGTSQTAAAMTIIGTRINAATNTTYIQYKVSFTPSTTGAYYLGVNVWAGLSPWYITFDDFNFDVTPPCVAPTLAVGTLTQTTASFSWSPAVTTGQIVVVPQGSAASVGTPSTVTGTTATVGSLTANTNYTAYIRKICGVADTSPWGMATNFTTPCNVYSIPWTESFETMTIPSGTTATNAQPACWARSGTVYAGNGSQAYNRMARTGNNFASVYYNSSNNWMFTPGFNLTAGTSYDFTFWYITDGLSGWDTIRVGVGSTQTAAGMTLIGSRVNAATNTTYRQYRVTYVPSTSGTYYFGVNVWNTTVPWYMTFDDFNVDLTPTCPQPTALTNISVGADTAVVRWTSNAPGSSWYVYYGAAGSTPGSNQGTLVTDTTTIIRGLTPNTNYSFYVREYCSAADTSGWTGPLNILTNCLASTPGDSMATAINVTGTSYTTSGSTTRCFSNTIGNTSPDVWYRVVLDPCATQISASLCTGTNFDSYLRIYDATGTVLLASNDDGCSSQSIISNLNISAHDTVYVVVEGFSSNTGTYGLTINQTVVVPVANIGYASAAYCQNAAINPTPTNSGTTGGAYSITPNTMTIDAISGTLSLASGQPLTTYNVLYTVGQPGCQAIDTAFVTINTPDNASFNYANSGIFCTTAGSVTPTISGLAGGMFSVVGAGLVIDSLSGVIDATSSMGGNYSITYYTNGACPSSSTVSVRIDTIQDASFMYGTSTVCANAATQPVTLTGLTGGMFSAPNGLMIDTLTGDINVMTSQTGSYVVTYTMPNACASSSTDTFTILAMDDASFSYAASTFCQNANNPMPTVTGLAGGAFSSNTGLPVDISSGIIDLPFTATGVTHTVVYATNGTCPNFSIVNIVVLPADTAEFSYPANTYCLTNNISVVTPSITGSMGGTFTAGAGLMLDSVTGVFHIDMMTSVNGTYTIMYVTDGPTTCPDTAIATVTLNTCVGVDEVAAQQGFAAYPNPTEGVFTLQNNGDDTEARLQIVDALGRVVYAQENLFLSKGGNAQINAQNLAAGTYYIRIWSNAQVTTMPLQIITR